MTIQRVVLAILNFNGQRHLEELLPSLRAMHTGLPFTVEVIVLDNCSTKPDQRWVMENFPEIKFVRAPQNDFLYSYNWLLAKVDAEICVLLNNDVRVTPGFLRPLCQPFEDNAVFAVSSKAFDWSGVSVTSGPAVLKYANGFYSWPFDPARQVKCPTLFCSGACMAVSRKKFLELGGFNRLFHPAYCEDLDICFRAWRRGWASIYQPESVIFHREHASWGESTKHTVNRLSLRSALLFQWSSLPLNDDKAERAARTMNLAFRGLIGGNADWFKVWMSTWIFWLKVRRKYEHLKVSKGELEDLCAVISNS